MFHESGENIYVGTDRRKLRNFASIDIGNVRKQFLCESRLLKRKVLIASI